MRSLLVAAAAVLLVATGCSGDDTDAAPTSTATPSSSSPTPEPTPTEPAEPALDPLTWESSTHKGQPGELVRVGKQFFGVETRAVARLTATGQDVWRFEGPATDDFDGFVVGGVPVATPRKGGDVKSGYQPHLVQGLDPRTGTVRWTRDATSSYTFSDGEHVVAPTCTGAVTGSLGDCTLTAYDPRTGDVAWTRSTWADVENAQEGKGFTLVQTFPTGHAARFVVLEPDGGVRSVIDPAGGGYLYVAGDLLVTDGADEQKVADGCRQQVTAYDPDGQVAWQRTFRDPPRKQAPKQCDTWSAIPVDDGVSLVSDRAPMLLSPRTGRTVWQGDIPDSQVYASSGGVVLVQDDREQRTLGVDTATGDTLWTFEAVVGGWKTWRGYATTNYACSNATGDAGTCTVVLDARTGDVLVRVSGVPRTFLPGQGGSGPSLLTRIDQGGYTATYGYVTLPEL